MREADNYLNGAQELLDTEGSYVERHQGELRVYEPGHITLQIDGQHPTKIISAARSRCDVACVGTLHDDGTTTVTFAHYRQSYTGRRALSLLIEQATLEHKPGLRFAVLVTAHPFQDGDDPDSVAEYNRLHNTLAAFTGGLEPDIIAVNESRTYEQPGAFELAFERTGDNHQLYVPGIPEFRRVFQKNTIQTHSTQRFFVP